MAKLTLLGSKAGEDLVTFLEGWWKIFPEQARSDIILASESYGGHYVPAWAGAINDYNEKAAKSKLHPVRP